jgi:hypothetical protein
MENYPYAVSGVILLKFGFSRPSIMQVDPFVAAPLNASCAALVQAYSNATRLEGLLAALNVAYNTSDAVVQCHNISTEYYPCAVSPFVPLGVWFFLAQLI